MKAFGLFLTFSKISLLTVGGGYAMIPVIREQLVVKRGLINDSEFLDAVVRAQSVPGAIAVNLSLIIGNRIAGISGSIGSLLGVVLPPFLVILLIAKVFTEFTNTPVFSGFLKGVRIGITAALIILSFNLIRESTRQIKTLVIIAVFAFAIVVFQLPSFWGLILCGSLIYIFHGGKR